MARRRTPGSNLPPLTMNEAHQLMREIGAHGDPEHPDYELHRSRVVDAIFLQLPAGHVKTIERAAAIFDVFRKSPQLIPGALPPHPATGYGSGD